MPVEQVGRRPVGYIVDSYPELSETFVALEVAELRRQDQPVEVVAIARGNGPASDEPVLRLSSYRGRSRLAAAHLRRALRNPSRYARFLRRVRLTEGSVPWRVLPALADDLAARRVSWVHAHFALEAADTAFVLAALLDVPWSFTAHAWDIFVARRRLPLKLARADRVVTVCDYNRAWIEKHYGANPNLRIVVCGVELPPRTPRRPTVDVVAVGRLVPKKGFDVLIRAVAHLAPTMPRLRVEIVGDGPERERLQALMAELGVNDHVTLCGELAHDVALARIESSRLLCIPARVAPDGDRDSMPVVGKEAMAREVPVVASAVAAIPEMIDDSVGRLVPPDDPAALAGALREVLASPELAASLGRAGRARVAERFLLRDEVRKLRSTFEELR